MSADRSLREPAMLGDLSVAGAWVPADFSAAGLVLTITVASYVRVGSLIFAFFHVTYPVTANGNNCSISGLPFTSKNDGGASFAGGYLSRSDQGAALTLLVFGNAMSFAFLDAATGAQKTNAQMSGKNVRGCIIYEVAPGQ